MKRINDKVDFQAKEPNFFKYLIDLSFESGVPLDEVTLTYMKYLPQGSEFKYHSIALEQCKGHYSDMVNFNKYS